MGRKRKRKEDSEEEDYEESENESPTRKKKSRYITWKEAIIKVLDEQGEETKIKKIAKQIVKMKYRPSTNTPHLTVSNIINTNINSDSDDVVFYRHSPGVYGLVEWLEEEDEKRKPVKRKKRKKRSKKKTKKKAKKQAVSDESEEEDLAEDEDIAETNIILKKRRRKEVDYVSMDKGVLEEEVAVQEEAK